MEWDYSWFYSLGLPPFTFLAFIFKGEYSLRVHFLLAMRAIFIDDPKDKSEGEEEINSE